MPISTAPSNSHTLAVDAALAAVAANQHGLITRAQLMAAGLSRGGIAKRVQRGALHRRHRGVYSVGHAVLAREGQMLAAVLGAGPGSVLSGPALAELHRLTRRRAPLIDVLSPRFRILDGVHVHRYRRLDRRDVTTERGIPVTTIHRLFVDLSDITSIDALANLIHEAAFLGRFSEPATRDAMARANGRHNLHVLESAIALHLDGSAGTRSRAERALLRLLRGFVQPRINVQLLGEEVDFLWSTLDLVIEVDGPGHGRPPTRRADEERDATLGAAGYRVVRIAGEDVLERPVQVLTTLRTLVPASRGP